ncbi:EpsI family protein [Sphingobium sufflavum]|uniref:exosortase A n=1 Tax=Sphingobium sufflavum TaxID=1129547 RepID=UPI001F42D72A|nr:exosortase A [Sphingobium sufflavum]MCE7797379.1 EpsI family protein [Sphingobium sufflavum]
MAAEARLGTTEWMTPARFGGLGVWPRHLLLLGAMAGLLLWLCRADMLAIIDIWARTGAFHHCFLIPPIIGWLVWQRRSVLAMLTPEYAMSGVLLAGVGALLWLAGAAAYVALFRQAGLVIAGQGLVIALLGVPVARALAFPLVFALFLIPAGSEFEPILQLVTADIAVALLHGVGTPAVLEGVFIETPAGLFRVAEACSGTAFLLAMAAYAMLVAAMCFTRWRRRILFLAAAMLAALLTNGIRAFGIMELANRTSIHNPIVQDHVLYGWLLFALVLGLLMAGASRWFDRDPDAPPADARTLQGVGRGESGGRVVVPALLLALLLPRLWLVATAPVEAQIPPPVAPSVPGWHVLPGSFAGEWRPHFAGATWIGQWRYARGAATVDLAVVLFDRQEEGRELVGFGQGAVAPEDVWAHMANAAAPANGQGEWLRGPGGRARYVASWYLVGGAVTGNRVDAKLAAVRARLTGGGHGAAAILLSAPGGEDAARASGDFLRAAGSVQEMADRARRMR